MRGDGGRGGGVVCKYKYIDEVMVHMYTDPLPTSCIFWSLDGCIT